MIGIRIISLTKLKHMWILLKPINEIRIKFPDTRFLIKKIWSIPNDLMEFKRSITTVQALIECMENHQSI